MIEGKISLCDYVCVAKRIHVPYLYKTLLPVLIASSAISKFCSNESVIAVFLNIQCSVFGSLQQRISFPAFLYKKLLHSCHF